MMSLPCSTLNSEGTSLARALRIRERLDAPTAGFFRPDHDPPLLSISNNQ
jgi:hypothetical protein